MGSPAGVYRVLVDSGSGDFWLADTSCKSDSCRGSNGGSSVQLYNPNTAGATSLPQDWSVEYIGGSVSGDVFTHDVSLGETNIASQAFGAANSVDNEELSSMNVSGILGLSLPSSSSIQSAILGNDTGNTLSESSQTGNVLAGLWRGQDDKVIGVGLERLPSDGGGRTANSSLAIRGVDPAYVPNDAQVQFSDVLTDANGLAHHWKVYLTDVFVTSSNDSAHLPTSFGGLSTIYPTVVIDTAAPLSYAPAAMLNALYGSYIDPSTGARLGPSDDGIYYVPCTLPLNITLTVGGVTVPIHPLDASVTQTTPDTTGSATSGCIGGFQSLGSGGTAGADIVLGAPFVRSAYSVFSCGIGSTDDDCKSPQLGLYPTTHNLTAAYDDFNQVRVQGKSLGSNTAYGVSSNPQADDGGLSTGAKIAIGIVVALAGLVLLFGFLVWFARRRAAKRNAADDDDDADDVAGGAQGSTYGGSGEKGGAGRAAAGSISGAGGAALAATPSRQHLSAKEQARLREAAIMHGYVEDDIVDEDEADSHGEGLRGGAVAGSAFASRRAGDAPEWDTSSQGYVDARRVRREYLERHPSLIEMRERRTDSTAEGSSAAASQGTTTLPTSHSLDHGMNHSTQDNDVDHQAHGGSDSRTSSLRRLV